MILSALNTLYDRLSADPSYQIATPGCTLQKVRYVLIITTEGQFVRIEDARVPMPKGKPAPRSMLLPGTPRRPNSSIRPNFTWDRANYLLGYAGEASPSESAEQIALRQEHAARCFEAFRDFHLKRESLIGAADFSSLCRFLERWEAAYSVDLDADLLGAGVVRVENGTNFVHECPEVTRYASEHMTERGKRKHHVAQCLVTGHSASIAIAHSPMIKGVINSLSSGAYLVSAGCDSFFSYGMTKKRICPVAAEVAFRYCTALASLTSGPRCHEHRTTLGHMNMLLWTDQASPAESLAADLLFARFQTESDETEAVTAVRSARSEQLAGFKQSLERTVHVLGLSGNAGRLSIRLWHTDSLENVFKALCRHYNDIRMLRPPPSSDGYTYPRLIPPWMFVVDFAPHLGGALMRSILCDEPYPAALARAVVRRIRIDHHVTYTCASFLKAWLGRAGHSGVPSVSLDESREDTPYCLGRLFAILENAQVRAQGRSKFTVRHRFLPQAAATPEPVFPQLLKGYQTHWRQLVRADRIKSDQLVQRVLDSIDDFPARMSLSEQAVFMIGYYHQRVSFQYERVSSKRESS